MSKLRGVSGPAFKAGMAGHTKSGKPIHVDHTKGDHKGWSAQDHSDAYTKLRSHSGASVKSVNFHLARHKDNRWHGGKVQPTKKTGASLKELRMRLRTTGVYTEQVNGRLVVVAAPITTGPELAKAIEKAIHETFPRSFVRSEFSGGITESISVRFALGNSKSDWANGIIQNDRLHHLFIIFGGFSGSANKNRGPVNIFDKGTPGEGDVIVGKLEATMSQGGKLFLPGSGMSGKQVKFGWRKKTGDANTIVKHFKDYFKKVKAVADANPDLMQR